MKYAVINENGMILRTGFCPEDMIAEQATGEGETSLPVHETISQGIYYRLGEEWVEYPPKPSRYHSFDYEWGEWVEDPTLLDQQASELARAKEEARGRINERAGYVRSKFITVSAGQDMIYLRKEQEAIAYVALDPEPEEVDLEAFPLLASEVGITAPTAYQVAQIWLGMSAIWRTVAASIEATRLTAINALDGATTLESVSGIMALALFELDMVGSLEP